MNQLKAKENLHVVFWLLKDFAWLMHFRLLGMTMVLPTIILGIWITVRTYRMAQASKKREIWSDYYHNLAISCWIMGNGIWMTGEFFFNDGIRPLAMPFFFAGLLVVGYYYLFVGQSRRMDFHK